MHLESGPLPPHGVPSGLRVQDNVVVVIMVVCVQTQPYPVLVHVCLGGQLPLQDVPPLQVEAGVDSGVPVPVAGSAIVVGVEPSAGVEGNPVPLHGVLSPSLSKYGYMSWLVANSRIVIKKKKTARGMPCHLRFILMNMKYN